MKQLMLSVLAILCITGCDEQPKRSAPPAIAPYTGQAFDLVANEVVNNCTVSIVRYKAGNKTFVIVKNAVGISVSEIK